MANEENQPRNRTATTKDIVRDDNPEDQIDMGNKDLRNWTEHETQNSQMESRKGRVGLRKIWSNFRPMSACPTP